MKQIAVLVSLLLGGCVSPHASFRAKDLPTIPSAALLQRELGTPSELTIVRSKTESGENRVVWRYYFERIDRETRSGGLSLRFESPNKIQSVAYDIIDGSCVASDALQWNDVNERYRVLRSEKRNDLKLILEYKKTHPE